MARPEAAKFLLRIASLDGQASYTQENCSALIARLLSEVDGNQLTIVGLAFGLDAIRNRKLSNLVFDNCYFAPTSLETTQLINCTFTKCKFSQLRVYSSTKFTGVTLNDCSVDTLRLTERDLDLWEPAVIRVHLERMGVGFGQLPSANPDDHSVAEAVDPELHDLERLLRYFMRSTHVSESVILLKLGNRGQGFIDCTLPKLLDIGILVEVENRGAGVQRRFKLDIPLHRVNAAISTAQGSYGAFLKAVGITV